MAIGKGLKEFALQQGFTVDKKYAYGLYHGYMTTLFEGMGYKAMVVSVYLEDSEKRAIEAWFHSGEYVKRYNLTRYIVADSCIKVSFNDNGMGTMNKLKGLLELLTAYMEQSGVKNAEYCSICGKKFGETDYNAETGETTDHGEKALVYFHETVLPVHTDCLNTEAHALEQSKTNEAEQGSIGKGFLGAFLGALVGAIPWVIVQFFGWFLAVLGALIGFCSSYGYDKLHGKKGKIKILAVVICSVLAVVAAVYACEIISGMKAIGDLAKEYGQSITLSEQFNLTMDIIKTDPEIKSIISKDIGLGLLFAALGMYQIIIRLFRNEKYDNETPVRIDK